MESGSSRRLFCWIVGIALVGRLGYAIATGEFGVTPPRDYREYVVVAERLLEHRVYTSPMTTEANLAPSCLMPPAYAGLVALAYRLLGVESHTATLALHLVNAAATSLAAGIVYLIGVRLAGAMAGVIAGLLAAIHPLLIGFVTYLWDTSLFAFGATLAVWWAMRLAKRKVTGRQYLYFGLFLGALALLNPALTIAYPLLVLYPAMASNGWTIHRVLSAIAWSVFGWAIAITPWTIRNYGQFHELVYVRCGFWLEVWLGVCPEADRGTVSVYRAQFPLLNEAAQSHVTAVGEMGFIRECRTNSMEAIKADPWRVFRLTAVRAMDYWSGTTNSHAREGQSGWPKSPGRTMIAVVLLFETVLMLMGVIGWGRRRPTIIWLFSIALLFSLIYVVTHVQVRYRMPVEPLVLIIAAVALTGMVGRMQPGGVDHPVQDGAPVPA